MSVPNPSIAIIGAGIGGLTAAIALRQFGFNVQVYEQATALGEIGAGITVGIDAGRILNALGLGQALEALEAPIQHIGTLHFATAERLTYEQYDVDQHQREHGTAARHVHRADLHALLVRTLESLGRSVHLMHELEIIRQDALSVDLNFAGGKTAGCDVVIACDGLKSVVRDQYFDTQPAHYTGMVAWRGLIERDAVPHVKLDPHFAAVPAENKLFARYSVRRGSLINYVAIARKSSVHLESWTARADVSDVLDEFIGWHGDVVDIIAATHPDRCMQWALHSRQPLATWIDGRVALLGDAAHPMTPFYGMGAMMAMEDAYVLARAFRAHRHDWRTALARYENARIERANAIHVMSLERGDAYLSKDAKQRAQLPEAGLGEHKKYNALTVAV